MKHTFKRVISIFLAAVIIVMAMPFAGLQMKASATDTRSDNFSKNYSYSSNPGQYVANIAKAQLGKKKADFGYIEDWCADFVCDCAKIAGQSSAVPPNGGVSYLREAVIKAGGDPVSQATAGDLVFYYCNKCGCYAHVGIALDSTYSIEGNCGGQVKQLQGEYYDASGHTVSGGAIIRSFIRPAYNGSSQDTTKPTDLWITANVSSAICVGQTVTFNYNIKGATSKSIGIDLTDKNIRYHSIGVSSDSGSVSYTFTEPGLYCCIIEGTNSAGYSCSSGVYVRVNSYANIGDDFYAYIIKKNSWKHLESSANGNVQIAANGNDSLDPKQIWHFLRQSDNSYKIINEYNNTCLDAYYSRTEKGTNVQTYESNDSSAQRWYMISSGGGYRIKAKHCDLYLDCLNDTDTPETNVQLWETSLDTAQVFSIYNVTKDGQVYSKPAIPPKVTGSATINPGDVTLSWTDSPVRNDYDKREFILTVYDSDNNLILKEEGLTGTSYTFNPPGKGRYHFSVKAINTRYYDWWSGANMVYFDINKPVLTICYDCRNSDFDIGIDESKGFFLSDDKVICTTTETNKEIDGIPNVFYQTIYEGCSIGEDGLFDFDDFGLTVPEGYDFSNYWQCRENNRKFSQSASFYTVLNFNPEYNGEPAVVHLTPAEISGVRLTVHFSGGLTTKTNRVYYMEKYGSLPTPISGREFKGWYSSSKGGSLVTEDTICTRTSNHTLYAHWVIPTFTVTLNNKGAYASGTEEVFYQYNEEKNESYYFYTDEDCTIPFDDAAIVCPKRAGYVFKGYFTEENGGGTQFIDENGVFINELNKQPENLTLYACWQTTAHIHSYEVSIIDATCTEPGKVVYSCSCGNTVYDIIPAIGHSYEEWNWSVIPTYQADGLMERECVICHGKETKTVSKPICNCCFEDEFVYGFNANSDVSDFVANYTIENDVEFSVLPVYKNKIGTGTVIKLEYPEHHSLAYNVVIFGDVNGDGLYDATDSIIVSCLANGILSSDSVDKTVLMAADCNHDGVINQLDVDLLNEAGVLLAEVDQSKSKEELLETSSAYVEYVNLICQTVETETSEVIEENSAETENPVQINWPKLFLSFINMLLRSVALLFKL